MRRVHGPSYPEIIDRLVRIGDIEPREARMFLDNFNYLQEHRKDIRPPPDGRWVASVNERFFYDASLAGLRSSLLARHENGRYAYIEQLL
jgi:hypothetical protein